MSMNKRIPVKDNLPRAEVFAPADEGESMLMYGRPGLEFEPTDAIPGTMEKIEVLSRRVELGLPLHHPMDRRTYEGCGGYEPKKDRWALPDFVVDERDFEDDYDLEEKLPREFR